MIAFTFAMLDSKPANSLIARAPRPVKGAVIYLEKVLPTSVADCPIFSIDEEAFFSPDVASSFSFKLTYNVPKSV